MRTAEFVAALQEQGIHLWMEGEALRYTARQGALTPALRAELVERKDEITRFLRTIDKFTERAVGLTDLKREVESHLTFVAPRIPTEKILVDIWSFVLRVERVGIHDNFFELGGDSLLAIQIVEQANRLGLLLTPIQVMQYQTIAKLAAVEGTSASSLATWESTETIMSVEPSNLAGHVPLVNGQRNFFRLKRTGEKIIRLFEVRLKLDHFLLKQAIQELIAQHDVLWTRFQADGLEWIQIIPVSKAQPSGSFVELDLSDLTETEQKVAIQAIAEELSRKMHLSESPLLQIALFRRGQDRTDQLLVILHHMIADAVSFRILLTDLEMACTQLSNGQVVQLPPKTAPFKIWAERLNAWAKSEELRQEFQNYWTTVPWMEIRGLPLDDPEARRNQKYSLESRIQMTLNVEATNVLLKGMPRLYKVGIEIALLAALGQSLMRWTKGSYLCVQRMDSGRIDTPFLEGLDVSRTMGYLALCGYLVLKQERMTDPAEIFANLLDQLRGIPHNGLGYQTLLYGSNKAEIVQYLSPYEVHDVIFNYLGQTRQHSNNEGLFRSLPESIFINDDQNIHNTFLLHTQVWVTETGLTTQWEYSQAVHKQSTIRAVMQDFIETLQSFADFLSFKLALA